MNDSVWTLLAERTRAAASDYALLEVARDRFDKTPEQLDEAERVRVLSLVEQKLDLEDRILGSDEAKELEPPTTAVDHAVAELVARFDSLDEYRASLRSQGMSEDDHRLAVERTIAIELVLERVRGGAPTASEADLRTLYDQQPTAFERPERRTVRHVLLITSGDSEAEKQTQEARLGELSQKLTERAAREVATSIETHFAELAEKNSQCPSALQGGLLGSVPRGVLYPELDRELFEMQPGEWRGPIETEAGLHLILLEAIEPQDLVPFAEARQRLAKLVNDRLATDHQRSWLAARRSQKG